MNDRVVAVAVYVETCQRLQDGSLLLHQCETSPPRRIVIHPSDIAPWPDAERLRTLIALLREARPYLVGRDDARIGALDPVEADLAARIDKVAGPGMSGRSMNPTQALPSPLSDGERTT